MTTLVNHRVVEVSPPKVRGQGLVFVGGGSGGHIYPGLAIAEEIARLDPDHRAASVLFVVSDRAIDARVMGGTSFSFLPSPARPMIARPKGLIRFGSGWLAAKRQAREILTRGDWQSGDGVEIVAMGGFVAAPFVSAGRSLGVPVTMVNLDAVPGKANAYIARRAGRIFTASRVPEMHRRGREWVEVPPIVRDGARSSLMRDECRRRLGLDPSRPVLVVTGGSQGLRSLNEFVAAFAGSDAGRALREDRWQILHQTGRGLAPAASAAYQSRAIDATVVEFSDQMGLWWGAANAAVCTAGAGTIAELWINRVPSLLLPYPHHKDEHQRHNAAPLVECGGAILGKDLIEPARNLAQNGPHLHAILSDAPRRVAMRANLEKLGPADGATRIARALLGG
ncbi:MAG TPA: UDP-N-acetylglucosamine--N-acetylmuramyl-(pentapeptide) pyrophosphoryl-undecaprenol N-acetylglucosamine transferase [Phycisphaerales bacterium]|nr:UDP-N-acetylglucosamine--N-acetylmuramyl-(pentapeptide) pyrophosphoryl-undecaprenol N-acetylglucosamine transferase [Phycisphaerales bacterium]